MKDTYVAWGAEVITVRGEDITVEAYYRYDVATGKKVDDSNLDSLANQIASDIYRDNHGIIRPGDVKQLRRDIGLSQSAFGNLIGVNHVTVSRYECGWFPSDKKNSLLLSLKDDIEELKRLFVKNKEKLTKEEQEKCLQFIEK